MKVLITGRTGQVGHALCELFKAEDLVATDRAALDLADEAALRGCLRDIRPQLIINAAAYTAVDRAESEPDAALAINGVAPGILAEEAKRLGAFLVHYSTDYVFDGRKAGAYLEGDAPRPLSVYGRTKLEGERRIIASGCRHLLLRTSWVYGPRGRNFFIAIARKARSLAQDARASPPLRVVADQHGVPTSSAYLAESTRVLLDEGAEGLLNVVPAGSTSWHGFAAAIVERLGLRVAVEPIGTDEYPTAARRPANSVLDIGKLSRLLGPRATWQQGLDRCVRQWSP